MRWTLAVIVVVGLSVPIAKADDKPTPPFSEPSSVAPEQDVRLTNLANAEPQTIGILTYYPNKGGGYTFLEGKNIAFYSLPWLPETYHFKHTFFENRKGGFADAIVETVNVFTIGDAPVPFGGQTLYHTDIKQSRSSGIQRRIDVAIGKWTRDTPDGKFRLSIMAEDSETRMKVKSIVPVLEASFLAEQKCPARKPASPITYGLNKDGSGYSFYQDGQRIAYSNGFDLFLCPSSNIKPSLKTDTLILDAGLKGGRGSSPR